MTELPPDARMPEEAIKKAMDSGSYCAPDFRPGNMERIIADAAGLHGYRAMEQAPELLELLLAVQASLHAFGLGTWGAASCEILAARKNLGTTLKAYRLQHPEGT